MTGHSRPSYCINIIKQLTLPVLLLLFSAAAHAQDEYLASYKPLTSSGTIPQDFLRFYIPSNEYDPSRLQGEEGERFREMNTVMMGRLFASGKVLFNDPLSNYAQKVLDTLLTREPSLRGKLRVYALRSAEANAFTSHDGKIFITTGFLANLENEAQLAYVLAHECIHYRNNHLFTEYRKRVNAVPGSLVNLRYSRELESEADIEGLRILLNSDYSPGHIDWVLDVLFYSYLPVDNVPLDKKFFEDAGFSIPDSCYLQGDDMGDIGRENDDYSELYQTHPSISNRKKEIKDFLAHRKKDTTELQFLFPEKEFFDMRNIARFELSYIYYIDHKLESSIYNSYVMLQEYPGNPYLQKMLAGAMYALCRYKQSELDFKNVHTPYKNLEGYQRQFSYLFEKLSTEQLYALASSYAKKISNEMPADKDVSMIYGQLRKGPVPYDSIWTGNKAASKSLLVIPQASIEETEKGRTHLSDPAALYGSFTHIVNEVSSKNAAALKVLDPYSLLKGDAETYNEYVFINDWVENRLFDRQHHVFIMHSRMEEIIAAHGDRVALVSLSFSRNKKTLALWPGLNKYHAEYSVLFFDLRSSQLVNSALKEGRPVKVPVVDKNTLEEMLFRKILW